jgi:hypothetical protein
MGGLDIACERRSRVTMTEALCLVPKHHAKSKKEVLMRKDRSHSSGSYKWFTCKPYAMNYYSHLCLAPLFNASRGLLPSHSTHLTAHSASPTPGVR